MTTGSPRHTWVNKPDLSTPIVADWLNENEQDTADALATALAAASTLGTHVASTSNPHATTKAQVGLGSVDNTSDAAKPLSTAATTALAAKASTTDLAAKVDVTERGPIGGVATSTGSGTWTPNATTASQHRRTATGATTVTVPTGGTDGELLVLWFLAAGADRVITFDAGYELSGPVPSRVVTVTSGQWGNVTVANRGGTWRLVSVDPVTVTIDASAITTGTVDAARLPAAAPYMGFRGLQATPLQTGLSANTWYSINLDTELQDVNSGHNPAVNPSRWYAGVTGRYLLTGTVGFGSATAGTRSVRFAVNGGVQQGSITTWSVHQTQVATLPAGTVPVQMSAGDYVEIQGSSSVAWATAADDTTGRGYLSATLIGL